jgi:hypothetical protein
MRNLKYQEATLLNKDKTELEKNLELADKIYQKNPNL